MFQAKKDCRKLLSKPMGFAILHLLPFLHFFRCFSGQNGSFVLQIVQFSWTWCSNHFVSYFEIQILHVSKFFNDFRGNRNLQKMRKKEKEERKEAQTKQRTKNEKPMRPSFLHASAILFSSVLVHLCVVNSTVNEWSDSVVVCATSCEVTQTGKFCKHTRMLCKHFFAWVRAKSRGFAPVSCVYCKPGFTELKSCGFEPYSRLKSNTASDCDATPSRCER